MASSLTIKYIIYVMRWVVLTIPGALLLNIVADYLSLYPAMLLTQGFLGLIVFWIDKFIIVGWENDQ